MVARGELCCACVGWMNLMDLFPSLLSGPFAAVSPLLVLFWCVAEPVQLTELAENNSFLSLGGSGDRESLQRDSRLLWASSSRFNSGCAGNLPKESVTRRASVLLLLQEISCETCSFI